MKDLKINKNLNSPLVDFNSREGLLKITGRSIPENPVKFYQPLDDWLSEYLSFSPNNITFFIHLDYLNTHSTECLLILIKKIEKYHNSSKNSVVKVEWNFDEYDEDMEDLGKDLAAITEVPFEFKEIV